MKSLLLLLLLTSVALARDPICDKGLNLNADSCADYLGQLGPRFIELRDEKTNGMAFRVKSEQLSFYKSELDSSTRFCIDTYPINELSELLSSIVFSGGVQIENDVSAEIRGEEESSSGTKNSDLINSAKQNIVNFYNSLPYMQKENGILLTITGQTGHITDSTFLNWSNGLGENKIWNAISMFSRNFPEQTNSILPSDFRELMRTRLRENTTINPNLIEDFHYFKNNYFELLGLVRAKSICDKLLSVLGTNIKITCEARSIGNHVAFPYSQYLRLTLKQKKEINKQLRKVTSTIKAQGTSRTNIRIQNRSQEEIANNFQDAFYNISTIENGVNGSDEPYENFLARFKPKYDRFEREFYNHVRNQCRGGLLPNQQIKPYEDVARNREELLNELKTKTNAIACLYVIEPEMTSHSKRETLSFGIDDNNKFLYEEFKTDRMYSLNIEFPPIDNILVDNQSYNNVTGLNCFFHHDVENNFYHNRQCNLYKKIMNDSGYFVYNDLLSVDIDREDELKNIIKEKAPDLFKRLEAIRMTRSLQEYWGNVKENSLKSFVFLNRALNLGFDFNDNDALNCSNYNVGTFCESINNKYLGDLREIAEKTSEQTLINLDLTTTDLIKIATSVFNDSELLQDFDPAIHIRNDVLTEAGEQIINNNKERALNNIIESNNILFYPLMSTENMKGSRKIIIDRPVTIGGNIELAKSQLKGRMIRALSVILNRDIDLSNYINVLSKSETISRYSELINNTDASDDRQNYVQMIDEIEGNDYCSQDDSNNENNSLVNEDLKFFVILDKIRNTYSSGTVAPQVPNVNLDLADIEDIKRNAVDLLLTDISGLELVDTSVTSPDHAICRAQVKDQFSYVSDDQVDLACIYILQQRNNAIKLKSILDSKDFSTYLDTSTIALSLTKIGLGLISETGQRSESSISSIPLQQFVTTQKTTNNFVYRSFGIDFINHYLNEFLKVAEVNIQNGSEVENLIQNLLVSFYKSYKEVKLTFRDNPDSNHINSFESKNENEKYNFLIYAMDNGFGYDSQEKAMYVYNLNQLNRKLQVLLARSLFIKFQANEGRLGNISVVHHGAAFVKTLEYIAYYCSYDDKTDEEINNYVMEKYLRAKRDLNLLSIDELVTENN